jgi:hypothetical protein
MEAPLLLLYNNQASHSSRVSITHSRAPLAVRTSGRGHQLGFDVGSYLAA